MTETVVLTGANRGIGLALARVFAEAGTWHVIAGCRRLEAADQLAALAAAHPGREETRPLDVADPASVAALVEGLGSRRVDLLLNNAGVLGSRQSVDDLDFDAWLEVLRVNTLAPMRLALASRPHLGRSPAPRIVTISSQMGALARPRGGSYAYRSSKAALNKAMQGLALDLADDGITVVVMHPGWVRTDMGGPEAEISVTESSEGIFRIVTRLGPQDSGRFLQWNGAEHPW